MIQSNDKHCMNCGRRKKRSGSYCNYCGFELWYDSQTDGHAIYLFREHEDMFGRVLPDMGTWKKVPLGTLLAIQWEPA